jgi:hypothetical protein
VEVYQPPLSYASGHLKTAAHLSLSAQHSQPACLPPTTPPLPLTGGPRRSAPFLASLFPLPRLFQSASHGGGRVTAPTPAMDAAPCSAGAAGWPPRAPEPHPHHPPQCPRNPRRRPINPQPLSAGLPVRRAAALGIPPESVASTKNQKGGEGVGGRKEAQEAGEKPGAAMVRGLRRCAGATVSPFVKMKTEGEGGEEGAGAVQAMVVDVSESGGRSWRRPKLHVLLAIRLCVAAAKPEQPEPGTPTPKPEPSVVKSPPRNRSRTCWRRRRVALPPLQQAGPSLLPLLHCAASPSCPGSPCCGPDLRAEAGPSHVSSLLVCCPLSRTAPPRRPAVA